ncbi:hypothetical protein [uncultured Ruminococcus sp.]|uniref:hypothetical protein n=1 Tax=uncultured Ruminococcus sp. TaxID=165186 RepID=UPI0025CE44E5|nr:hypothetical protein [uncultured Ruminococcus sp.]
MKNQKETKIKREPKDPKVPLPLKVQKSLFDEIDQEAKEKGVPRTDVAVGRLKHYPIPLTPALMYELENKKNQKYGDLKPDMPQEALDVYEEVARLWKRLK